MNLARARSVALLGMDAELVEIEVWIGGGLPRTVIVGLPDAALYEARDRCRAAVTSSGLQWPGQLVTINLTPATLPKAGAHYDLGIVAAVLAASGAVPSDLLDRYVLLGELGLDGRVRAVRGVLPALMAAVRYGFDKAIVPAEQLGEASLVDGVTVWGAAHLDDLVAVLKGEPSLVAVSSPHPTTDEPQAPDLVDVVGQWEAKWALEVAAAGRHHLYLHGPPGVGKTLLARRLPSILPDLSVSEALEVSAVQSLAGLPLVHGLVRRPPYSDPHHTASIPSLIGGGPRVPRPGAVSLAHLGVLFMDEAPEFGVRAMDALRVPLETGQVVIGRSEVQVRYPARFQLVMAANPCPCGMAGTPGANCQCPPHTIRRYAARISGPVLDRVDVHQHLRPLKRSLVSAGPPGETSSVVAARVAQARERQTARLAGTRWRTNAEVSGAYLRSHLPLPEGIGIIDEAVARGSLSSRGVDKVLRLAWTIADLEQAETPTASHLRLALALRRGEDLGRVAA